VALAMKVSARLKVMARLDIAERRIPQDGRIKMKLSKNRAIDFLNRLCLQKTGQRIHDRFGYTHLDWVGRREPAFDRPPT
jgi:hypothetical protein